MEKKLFSIQGILFQEGHALGLGDKPGVGLAVKIQKAMVYAIYHGVVGPSEDGESFCGQMHDRYGDSEISELLIGDTFLQFTKKYQNRPPILYSFREKNGNVWIGTWMGDDCGVGKSKCIVTQIEESFFDPEG